jgi:subtilisin family serine protease
MKKYVIMMMTAGLFLASCKKTSQPAEESESPERFTSQQIDGFIREKLRDNGRFEWSMAGTDMIWSALQQSDQVLSVGYKPEAMPESAIRLHEVDIRSKAWSDARAQVMQIILEEERMTRKDITEKDLVQWDEQYLPVIDVRIENYATLKRLLSSKLIRYAEPMGYEPSVPADKVSSSSGCDGNGPESLVENADYSSIAPGCKQSWNHPYHKISSAWTKSSGAGVKVFVIDTGCEFDQDNLGTAFNQGYSSGRTIEKIVTLPRSTFLGIPTGPVETADDGCGHGTAMAGALAAPRGIDGAACGIAYNCNLVTCRAAADVFLDESREVKGASDAFTNAANRSDVRIISMSMGKITSSSQLKDAIVYAYGKNKLIFCAAGTSFSWTSGWYGVIFPAYLAQVNAVTGVRDNSFTTTCTTCHDGSETDFTVVMEKASNERHPITLAASGNVPSTVGGSSVSTAQTAGMAALVWSRFPTYTRDQVLNKLVSSGSNYPTRNSNLGWGNIDADKATN